MENHLFDFIEQFMPLSDEEKKALSDLDIVNSFKRGTVLLKEGDRISDGYFIIKGCLRSYYLIDGEEKTTAFYTEMEALVPVPGPDESRAAHYVSCVEDSIVTISSPDMSEDVIVQYPRFEKLCLIISEQLLAKNLASFADFKNSSPEQRYLNLLETRPDLLQRVPQHQIASFLGMTPQSLSRIRKRLASRASLLT